jgi:hypothetical protein
MGTRNIVTVEGLFLSYTCPTSVARGKDTLLVLLDTSLARRLAAGSITGNSQSDTVRTVCLWKKQSPWKELHQIQSPSGLCAITDTSRQHHLQITARFSRSAERARSRDTLPRCHCVGHRNLEGYEKKSQHHDVARNNIGCLFASERHLGTR